MGTKVFKAILMNSIFLVLLSCSSSSDNYCYLEVGKDLYLQKWHWGVNGNSQLIVLSNHFNNDKSKIDKAGSLVFEGSFPFFLKSNGDTIKIYTYKTVKGPNNISKYRIIQIEIDNKET
ncbi:MAG: hypothetical protein WBB45_03840 [Cyclobacteriaceae bacterium]